MTGYGWFLSPTTVREALTILEEKGATARIVAGGTDVMVRVRRKMLPETETTLLSLHRVEAMRGVRIEGDELVIGAGTTAADLMRDPLIAEHARILKYVAGRLASGEMYEPSTA